MDSEFFKKYFNLFYLTQILRTLKSELQTFRFGLRTPNSELKTFNSELITPNYLGLFLISVPLTSPKRVTSLTIPSRG